MSPGLPVLAKTQAVFNQARRRVPKPMLAPLFAFRSTWLIIILIILLVIGVAWFVVRVVVDATTWFREEVLYDIRDHRRKKQAPRTEKKVEENQRNLSE